jgi:PIN domain nuclease of toxin-antitoxin system
VPADVRLSKRARHAIGEAARQDAVALSAISIWEVAKKVEKGQLTLDRRSMNWLDQALGVDGLQVLEPTRGILVDSCRLPQPFRGDPADQIIVATARKRTAFVITADTKIREYPHVQTMW